MAKIEESNCVDTFKIEVKRICQTSDMLQKLANCLFTSILMSVEPNGFADLNKEPSLHHLTSIRTAAGSKRRTRLMEMTHLIDLFPVRPDHIHLCHVKRSLAYN